MALWGVLFPGKGPWLSLHLLKKAFNHILHDSPKKTRRNWCFILPFRLEMQLFFAWPGVVAGKGPQMALFHALPTEEESTLSHVISRGGAASVHSFSNHTKVCTFVHFCAFLTENAHKWAFITASTERVLMAFYHSFFPPIRTTCSLSCQKIIHLKKKKSNKSWPF